MIFWDDIEGQELAKARLTRMFAEDRVHHGNLFTGPDGVGKFATAVGFTQLMNCEHPTSNGPCGTCRSCSKIKNSIHPDIRIVSPQGASRTIKIADIRDVQKMVKTRPFEARYQVIIIDDADRMTIEACNALLKTLEEPPESVRLILVTSKPNALLDTIRSRCQATRFVRLSDDSVHRIVSKIAGEPVDPLITRLSQGSPGRAVAFLEEGLFELQQQTLDAVLSLQKNHPKQLLETAAELARDKQNAPRVLDALSFVMLDLAALKANALPLVNTHRTDELDLLASRVHFLDLERLQETISITRQRLARNGNVELLFTSLITDLAVAFHHD